MDDGGGRVKARYVSFNSLRMGNWMLTSCFVCRFRPGCGVSNGRLRGRGVDRGGVARGGGYQPRPPPFEIRWDAGSGVRVEDEGESESGYGSQSSSVKISLSANGPWAPVGVRQLGASSAAAVGVGPNRGTALVVDRRRGCVRAPATLTSLLPFQLEARTVRLTETKLKTKTLPGKTLGKTLDGDAAVGSIVVEVFESERFFPFLGWQEPKGQLDEFFTARFSRTVSGKR